MQRDITLLDLALSRINSFVSYSRQVMYSVRNWYVLLPLSLKLGEHTIISRSGKPTKVSSWKDFVAYWNSAANAKEMLRGRIGFHIAGGRVSINYKKRKLRFLFGGQDALNTTLGDIYEQFAVGQYAPLKVSGKTVVDIGASIGDTAIYFALNGAKHVYAFEPFPFSYTMAKNNTKANNLSGRITMINEGCGGKGGTMAISARYRNIPGSSLRSHGSGRRIKIVTLPEIVRRYGLSGAILKSDCEGCEYGLILNADVGTLRKFDQIMMEYHYGYRRLAKKLRQAGFKVTHTRPRYFVSRPDNNTMYVGDLYARRKES